MQTQRPMSFIIKLIDGETLTRRRHSFRQYHYPQFDYASQILKQSQ